MAQIVTIGEILVEIMATRIGQTFLEPGLFAGPYPSGAPAIFADQAARVGAATALISCVGPDDFGTLNLNRLRASGVEVRRDPAGARHDDGQRLRHLSGRRRARLHLQHRRTRPRPPSTRRSSSPACSRGCRFFHVMGSSLFSARIARGRAARRRAGQGRRARRSPSTPTSARSCWRCPRSRPPSPPCWPSATSCCRATPTSPISARASRKPRRRASLLAAGRRMVLLKKGAQGSVYYGAEPSDRDAGLPGRGGRPDRRRRLLRRHLRRLPGAGRAAGAGAAPGQCRRRAGGRRRRGRWRAIRPWPSSRRSWSGSR